MRCLLLTLLFLTFSLLTQAFAQSNSPQLWYWQYAYPESPSDVSAIENQINLAVSYGYTGVAFWSATFDFMGSTVDPANNVAYMQQVISYAQSLGMKTIAPVAPYGYSDDWLVNNPSWAEGEQLMGSEFTVNSSATALIPINSFPGLVNPGFESGMTGWFGFGDPNMGVTTAVAHSGNYSGYITNATGNSRFEETLNVTPWRQYQASIWIKTSNFSGYSQIEVWDPSTNTTCFNTSIVQASTQDWTELTFTFNSRGTSQPLLLFGVWGGSSGTIYFDDVYIAETSLIYVLRRPGTPLTVYNPNNPSAVYQEGLDFNPIADPQLSSGGGFNGFYHAPATVTLPRSTSLQPGQTVAMNYYAVQPVSPVGDVGICLTETAVQNWLQTNAQNVVSNLPAGINYMLSYDEMRHMDSCASCKAKNMTPGQLLAWHVTNTINLYHSLAPSASLYVWSDMFDPYANAVNDYYFVEGNIAGSWTAVPSTVTIMNWNLGNLTNSLSWFSGQNSQQPTIHPQIIAGYYDSGNGAASATQELQQAAGVPGVVGLMYTTWNPDYSQLQPFAAAAKSNWAAYLATIPDNVSSQITVSQSVVTFNRISGLYSQTVKLTNNGPALTDAAYVAASLPSGVAMYQPTGVTASEPPVGSPYKDAGPMGAGATVTLTVQFTRTGTPAITYTPVVLGPGPR